MPTTTQGTMPTPEDGGIGAQVSVNLVALDNVGPIRAVDANISLGRTVEWVPAAGELGIQLGDQWVPTVLPVIGKDDFLADVEVELQTGFPSASFPLFITSSGRFDPEYWSAPNVTESFGPYPDLNPSKVLYYPTVGVPQLISTTFLDCEQGEHNPGLLVAAPCVYHFPGGLDAVDSGYECGHPGFRWNMTAAWDATAETLTLSSERGFDIKYSTDGSYPSTDYTAPIDITGTDTIRFRAVDSIGCSGPAYWTDIDYVAGTPPTPPASFAKGYPRILYDDFSDTADTADDERGIAYRWTLNDHDEATPSYPIRNGYWIPDGMGGTTTYSAAGTRVTGRFLPSTSKGGNLSIIAYRTKAVAAGAVTGTAGLTGEKSWEIPSRVTIMTRIKIGKLTASWDASDKLLTLSTASTIADSIEYQINGGGWLTYSAPLSITETTTVSLVARGTDTGSNTVADSDEHTLAITYSGTDAPADFAQDFYTALPSEDLVRVVRVGALLPLYPTRFVSPSGTGDGLSPDDPCAIDDVVVFGDQIPDTTASIPYDLTRYQTVPSSAVWNELTFQPYSTTLGAETVVKWDLYNVHQFLYIYWGTTTDRTTFVRYIPTDNTTWPRLTDGTIYFEARPRTITRTDEGTAANCTVNISQSDNGVSSTLSASLTFPGGSGESANDWTVNVSGAYARVFRLAGETRPNLTTDCVGVTQQIYPQPSGAISVSLNHIGAERKAGSAWTGSTSKGEVTSASVQYYSAPTYTLAGGDPVTPVFALTRKTGTTDITAVWDATEKTLTCTGIPAGCTLLIDTGATPATPYSEPLVLNVARTYKMMLNCNLSKTNVQTLTAIDPETTAGFSSTVTCTWAQDSAGLRNKFTRTGDVIWLSEGTHEFPAVTGKTARPMGRWYGGFDESFSIRDRSNYQTIVNEATDGAPLHYVNNIDGVRFTGDCTAFYQYSFCEFFAGESAFGTFDLWYCDHCTVYGRVANFTATIATSLVFADMELTDYFDGRASVTYAINCDWDFGNSADFTIAVTSAANSRIIANAASEAAYMLMGTIYESNLSLEYIATNPEAVACDWKTGTGLNGGNVGTNGDLVAERNPAHSGTVRWSQDAGIMGAINSTIAITLTPADDIIQPDLSGYPANYVTILPLNWAPGYSGNPILDLSDVTPVIDSFNTLTRLTYYSIRSSVEVNGDADTNIVEGYTAKTGLWDWETGTWSDTSSSTITGTTNPLSIEMDYMDAAYYAATYITTDPF